MYQKEFLRQILRFQIVLYGGWDGGSYKKFQKKSILSIFQGRLNKIQDSQSRDTDSQIVETRGNWCTKTCNANVHAEKEDKEASILGGWLLGGLLCGDWWSACFARVISPGSQFYVSQSWGELRLFLTNTSKCCRVTSQQL